jgi:5'-3' exonuclease
MPDNRPILLIDGKNVFMQMWHAFHSTTTGGKSAGGIVGFLTAISKYSESMQPSQIYVAWENGQSEFRKKILPEYKLNRKQHPSGVIKDRTEQLISLINILKHTPICQVYLSGCEGDDIIAYMCNKFSHSNKTIISADRDYYQLLDEKTKIFAPVRKYYVDENTVKNKYGILPQNFVLFKSLCGDGSDNISGIRGLGEKRLKKLFPEISTTVMSLEDVYRSCQENLDKNSFYKKILEEFESVEKYWKIIQLKNTILTSEQIQHVDTIIEQHQKKLDHQELIKAMMNEGLSFNHERLFITMNNLCIL